METIAFDVAATTPNSSRLPHFSIAICDIKSLKRKAYFPPLCCCKIKTSVLISRPTKVEGQMLCRSRVKHALVDNNLLIMKQIMIIRLRGPLWVAIAFRSC